MGCIQHDAAVTHGYSGGPVMSHVQQRAVGMCVCGATGRNFALPMDFLAALVADILRMSVCLPPPPQGRRGGS